MRSMTKLRQSHAAVPLLGDIDFRIGGLDWLLPSGATFAIEQSQFDKLPGHCPIEARSNLSRVERRLDEIRGARHTRYDCESKVHRLANDNEGQSREFGPDAPEELRAINLSHPQGAKYRAIAITCSE
jgi:hypothetical protein